MANEVDRNLERLINSLDGALANALEVVAQSIENDAKEICPVDDGILRASLTHEVKENERLAIIGTNVEYAPYVHEGTGIYATGGNGRKEVPWRYQSVDGKWYTTKGQKPQPFLRKAIDANINKTLNTMGREIKVEWMK